MPARGKLSYAEPEAEAYETDQIKRKGEEKRYYVPFHCTLGSVGPVHGGRHWSILGNEESGVWQA